MAIVEINCPYCSKKQKVATRRLSTVAMCMHCGKEISDVYLYKIKPPPPKLKNKLKGTIISEFGQTSLDDLESESAFLSGDRNSEEKPTQDDMREAAFIDRVHIGNLESSAYMPSNKRVLSVKARTYLIAAVVTLVLMAIATVSIVQFLPDGKQTHQVTSGTGAGERVEKYPSGQVKSKWTIKELADGTDVIDGEWLEYHKNGTLKVEGQYLEGQKQGEWITYFSNGKVESRLSYAGDRADGDFRNWHENGNKAEVGKWHNGEKAGEWVSWHANGKIAGAVSYKDGMPNGRGISYYDNEKPKVRGEWKTGQKHGNWIEYYRSGAEKENTNWHDGKLHGVTTGYKKNGKVDFKGEWTDGKLSGKWSWWASAGGLVKEGHFLDGEKHGLSTVFNVNGTVKSSGEYDSGLKTGDWVEMDMDGAVVAKLQFEAGQVLSSTYFFKGKVVVWTEILDDQGNLAERWSEAIRDGKQLRHGHYSKLFSDGEVQESGIYIDDQKHGLWKTFSRRGRVTTETKYNDGVEVVED